MKTKKREKSGGGGWGVRIVRFGGRGQGGCERRNEAFMKIQIYIYFFFGGGELGGWVGGRGVGLGGVRVDVNGEVEFL